MFQRSRGRRIRYVYSEVLVERVIEENGVVLAVDMFRRSPGDPSPIQVTERVVDSPVIELGSRRGCDGRSRGVYRPVTGGTVVEFDECWQEVYS